MLQLYSASWCSTCSAVKKFLDDNKIAYVERDLDMDPTAKDELSALKIRSIPVLFADERNFVIGAAYEAINALVKRSSKK